jgi:hypothetical protein
MATKVLEFPADRIAKGVHSFTPEMGQRKPNCQMQASIGHYGGYYIRTPLELKGRGIKLVDTSETGVNRFKVSDMAFQKLKSEYSISSESNLD